MVEDQISSAIIGMAYGVVFGLYGVLTKKPKDEKFDPRKITRTILVFGAAGALVSVRGGDLSPAQITSATAETAALGVIFDMFVSRLQRGDDG